MDPGPETHPRSQLCDISGRDGHAPHVMTFLGVISVERCYPSIASSALGNHTAEAAAWCDPPATNLHLTTAATSTSPGTSPELPALPHREQEVLLQKGVKVLSDLAGLDLATLQRRLGTRIASSRIPLCPGGTRADEDLCLRGAAADEIVVWPLITAASQGYHPARQVCVKKT